MDTSGMSEWEPTAEEEAYMAEHHPTAMLIVDPDCLACAACGELIGRSAHALTASNAVVHLGCAVPSDQVAVRRHDATLLAVIAQDDHRPAVKEAVARVLAAADSAFATNRPKED